MTEAVGKEIALEGVDPRELYGAQNVYLEQIRCAGSHAEDRRARAVAQGPRPGGRHAAFRPAHGGACGLLHQIRACFGRGHRPVLRGRHRARRRPGRQGRDRLRQQRHDRPRPDRQPAAARQTLRQERPAVRRGSCRLGQDLYGHRAGRPRAEGAAGAAHHPHASGRTRRARSWASCPAT